MNLILKLGFGYLLFEIAKGYFKSLAEKLDHHIKVKLISSNYEYYRLQVDLSVDKLPDVFNVLTGLKIDRPVLQIFTEAGTLVGQNIPGEDEKITITNPFKYSEIIDVPVQSIGQALLDITNPGNTTISLNRKMQVKVIFDKYSLPPLIFPFEI